MVISYPDVSTVKKEYQGKTCISFKGNVLGYGENSLVALEMAKMKDPNIEEKEFTVSRIYHDEILAF